jgi:uncharacterized protein (TIGR03437 family)
LTQLLFSTDFNTVNGLTLDASGFAWVVGTAPPPAATGTGSNPPPSQGYLARIDPAPVQISLDSILSASPPSTLPQPATQAEGLAPGKVIRLIGRGIGPAVRTPGLVSAGVVTTAVAGVQVTFDGIPAPLLYVSATEIGCIVPFATAGRSTTTMQVIYHGAASNAVPVPLRATAPDVLAVFNADSTANSASNPAPAGSIIELYVTGAGQTAPASTDGQVYAPPLPQPASRLSLGDNFAIVFAAAADGLAGGILQVNFAVPALPSGLYDLTLTAGTATTNFILYVQ